MFEKIKSSSLSPKLKLPTKIYKISKLCGVEYDVLSFITKGTEIKLVRLDNQ